MVFYKHPCKMSLTCKPGPSPQGLCAVFSLFQLHKINFELLRICAQLMFPVYFYYLRLLDLWNKMCSAASVKWLPTPLADLYYVPVFHETITWCGTLQMVWVQTGVTCYKSLEMGGKGHWKRVTVRTYRTPCDRLICDRYCYWLFPPL